MTRHISGANRDGAALTVDAVDVRYRDVVALVGASLT
ncbi:ABC transporter, partial [Rhodococcus fascians]|nr:ABC transporter [Rhodococcus fascians]